MATPYCAGAPVTSPDSGRSLPRLTALKFAYRGAGFPSQTFGEGPNAANPFEQAQYLPEPPIAPKNRKQAIRPRRT